MTYCDSKLKIFTCNSNPKLASQIADYIGIPMGSHTLQALVTERSRLSFRKVSGAAMSTLSSLPAARSTIT